MWHTELSIFLTRTLCFLLALFCFALLFYLRRQGRSLPEEERPLHSQLVALNQKLSRELFESRAMLSLWKESDVLEPKQFLSVMLEQLLQGLNLSFGCVIVRSMDQAAPELVLAAKVKGGDKPLMEARTEWTHIVSKELEQYLLYSDDRALSSADLATDSIVASIEPGGKKRPLQLISVGIRHGQVLLGSLHLISESETFFLEPWQQDFLKSLASQARLILENRSLQHYVRVDALTGLFNRGHFDEKLKEESLRFGRSGKPFSLIMLDVDHFKKINDNYGHQVGDEILVAVAHALKRAFRGSDTICRYGGEEFAVILTQTQLEGAKIAAENARRLLREICLPHEPEKKGLLTVSMGISSFPLDSQNHEDLLRIADQRLYRAKQMGRDRFVSESVPKMPEGSYQQ